ncbi:hypothetical protein JTB14_031315 [Gonioctena quinquepunctata]|nr:hypothetical protein JTB14_031315 [Gonioctena quinquepunctata]
MLVESHSPKEMWAGAANTAFHLLNRFPAKKIRGATPEEKWTGCKVNLSHLKVFGCKAYVHVPDMKIKNLTKRERRSKIDIQPEVPILTELSEVSTNESNENGPVNSEDDSEVQADAEGEVKYERLEDSNASSADESENVENSDRQVVEENLEALSSAQSSGWKSVIKKELNAFRTNNTWELIDKAIDQKIVKNKWVFEIERNQNGDIAAYRA